MAGRKRRSGVWHHRAPDFKLVYCGPRERVPKKEEDNAAERRLEQQKIFG